MMQFLESGRDLATALPGDYDLILVIISVYAAAMGAYAAVTLADRLREPGPQLGRWLWLAVGAIAMGGGVWTMHFIGMLAFRLPIQVDYEVTTTLASMLPAIFAAAITLHVIARAAANAVRILVGGVLMGAGIGIMHYIGMAAMRFDGEMRYEPFFVALSVVVAIALAALSLHVKFSLSAASGHRFSQDWSRIVSAMVMGVAISGMHYTAMASVFFFQSDTGDMQIGVNEWVLAPGYLGTVIGVTSGVVIGLLIIAVHERELGRRRRAEQKIHQLNEGLEGRVADRTRELGDANNLLQARGHELEAINELSSVLQSSATIDDACEAVRVFTGRLFPDASGVMYITQGSNKYLERATSWGEPRSASPVVDLTECWALRRGGSHVVADTKTGLVCSHVESGDSTAYVCSPLMAHSDMVGLLYLEHPHWRDTPALPRVIQTLCEQISIALANIRLRDTLYLHSVRDSLTGLFNRRYVMEAVPVELARASRGQKPLSVVLIDIDHFKKVNDKFGHDAGDTVLREIALSLRTTVRESDVAARYGGEEFLLMLPETSRNQATAVAEKVRKAVANLNLEHQGQRLNQVTLSAGVAVFPEDASTADQLIRIADKNLYAAKSLGRDRVVEKSTGR